MATQEQIQLGREVAEYFTRRPGTEFVGFAGIGRHGGALVLKERDANGQFLRMVVIKYSLGALTSDQNSNADDDLRNEYRWLEMLRGAEHIVQLVPFADCSLNLPGISNGEDTFEESLAKLSVIEEDQKNEGDTSPRGAKLTKESLRARKCPTFALEYLPNGTLSGLIDRIAPRSQLIPNRMMWRIWLCMVRQCIAMAFPPLYPPENGKLERERFLPDVEFFTLTQNSAHLANYVFGEESPLSPDSDHDPGVPLVKLIDFGRGRVENPKDYIDDGLPNFFECGARANLWSAACVMGQLACPLAPDEQFDSDHPVAYNYMKDNIEHTVMTDAAQVVRESAEMDVALRDTIARCMSSEMKDSPSLQEVLAEAEDKVANRGPDDNPDLEGRMGLQESDEYIRQFLQAFVYNR
ncbi:hypothetical protein F4859DRAFT_522095 [Xylaria cf. heliscus]|nr:hypothetical protein F4859DRAFT_522095 [Xylaria cf. heliscus]